MEIQQNKFNTTIQLLNIAQPKDKSNIVVHESKNKNAQLDTISTRVTIILETLDYKKTYQTT
jgi:hypothetical protein